MIAVHKNYLARPNTETMKLWLNIRQPSSELWNSGSTFNSDRMMTRWCCWIWLWLTKTKLPMAWRWRRRQRWALQPWWKVMILFPGKGGFRRWGRPAQPPPSIGNGPCHGEQSSQDGEDNKELDQSHGGGRQRLLLTWVIWLAELILKLWVGDKSQANGYHQSTTELFARLAQVRGNMAWMLE